jgi:hypothetical protein
MAVYSMTSVGIFVDGYAVHGNANQLDLSATADTLDFTTFSSGGWKIRKPGLATHSLSVDGFQDYATTGVDPVFPVSSIGGFQTFTVAPTGGATVADPAFIGQGLLNTYTPLTGAVGDPAMFNFGWTGSAQLVRAQMLHPSAARTTTGSGTATTFTTPTATQTLYASFHVLSVTGAGTITFTIQTDDAVGFPSPVTRITSSAFAAVGGGFGSLAGALAGETHIRAGWTVAGFSSVTFAIAAGVL